jgi:hypothetical protein
MSLGSDPALLRAVSAELASASADVKRLSDLVSEVIIHCPEDQRDAAVVRAQGFDEIIQRLEGLSGLAAALAAGASAEAALATLTLSGLRQRLSGVSDEQTEASLAGELTLFD